MEQALATTETGQKMLDVADERMNHKSAEEMEEADARPERGIGAAGPDIGLDDLFEGSTLRSDGAVLGTEPAGRVSTRGARRQTPEKHGTRALLPRLLRREHP